MMSYYLTVLVIYTCLPEMVFGVEVSSWPLSSPMSPTKITSRTSSYPMRSCSSMHAAEKSICRERERDEGSETVSVGLVNKL